MMRLNIPHLLGGLAGAALIASCGVESTAKQLNDDKPLPALSGARSSQASVTPSDKDASRAALMTAAAGSCTVYTGGKTAFQRITVPANSTVTCSTINATTLDTVLALLRSPDYSATRDPCMSPYVEQIPWNVAAFNDDANGTAQSLVSFRNTDGIARDLYVVGFLYAGSTLGAANVTCSFSNGTSTVLSVNFNASSCRGVPSNGTVYTSAGGADTTLLGIVQDFTNQNHKSNDDCNTGATPSPQSCLSNMSTALTWFVDIGCYGGARNTTINY